MEEENKITIGDAIQGLGGLTHPNEDNLHFEEDLAKDIDEKRELSEEDMKTIINKEKTAAKILKNFDSLNGIFKTWGIGY